MINTKLQSIIDTKSAIGNAIVNKGGTITSATPFFNYAAEIDNISTGPSAYSNWVVQDENGAKYQFFNGYDFVTNPTPSTTNLVYNQWTLNNSATGDVVLSNTVMSSFAYNGPSSTENIANLALLRNTATSSANGEALVVDNGYLYGTIGVNFIRFNLNDISKVDNSTSSAIVNYGGFVETIAINNGYIYVGGFGASFSAGNIRKYHQSNLVFVGNTASYGAGIADLAINNGFIYAGGGVLGGTNRGVSKYHESNLVLVGNTVNYGGDILSVTTNNGFIYAGGVTNRTVQKFHESNLAFVGNTASYDGTISKLVVNNGFIYAVGENATTPFTNCFIQQFHESNLARGNNSISYGNIIQALTINSGFLYIGGRGNNQVQKFYETNLTFVGNSVGLTTATNAGGQVVGLTTDNDIIYAGGTINRVQLFQERQITSDNSVAYNIVSVKE
jgi:hypothetical protein